MRLGNRHMATKISAMQEIANRNDTQVSTIQAISSSIRLSDYNNPNTDDNELNKKLVFKIFYF